MDRSARTIQQKNKARNENVKKFEYRLCNQMPWKMKQKKKTKCLLRTYFNSFIACSYGKQRAEFLLHAKDIFCGNNFISALSCLIRFRPV